MADPKDGTQPGVSAGPDANKSSSANATPQATPATVATKPERYLIASRSLPGVQPMATDVIVNTLNAMPDARVVRRLKSSGISALSLGGGGVPEIIVAEMDPTRGAALRATAPQNVIVERDALLRHADAISTAELNNAMLGVGIDIQIRVIGGQGTPLPKATIYVYGMGFPAQGVTDNNGEARITFFGPIESVQGIYIKPFADHWDRLVRAPNLQASGFNTLQVRPLSESFQGFPDTGIVGWGQQLMKLDQIDRSLTGSGIKIGIIDSGCDNTHPQLTHVANGVDFTNGGDSSSWRIDTMGHGTHCAGIITGGGDPRRGIRGFAPGAEIHSLKVFPGGRFSDLLDAMDHCIDKGIDIVNMSLGSGDASELVVQKIAELRQHGIACIVAAGNTNGPVQFPGSVPGVFTVAAIGKLDTFPRDSNHAETFAPNLESGNFFSPNFTCFGPQVASAAPGVAIVSTVPGGGYAAWDGTSMATPHVTGLGALLLAHHPVFQSGARLRNEQRVQQLFALMAAAAVHMLGAPLREGAGVIDLQRVPGFSAPGNVHLANSPSPTITPTNISGPLGGAIGGFFGNAGLGQQIGSQLGNVAMQSSIPPLWAVDPAVVQRLIQLRLAGLV